MKYILKQYSLKEGQYTGPKKLKKVPGALNTITKSILAGIGIGAGVGAIDDEIGIAGGAKKGAVIGLATGIAANYIIKKMHEPMSTIKYDKVDKYIRTKISLGNKINKENFSAKTEDLFAFNDSSVMDYRVNVSIQKKSVTAYLSCLEPTEITIVDKLLDNYCYKYFGMEYTARLLNKDTNSYAITIIFTNHTVIADFLIELAKKLSTRINLLDNRAPITLSQEEITLRTDPIPVSVEKKFSNSGSSLILDKYDLMKIFGGGGLISGVKFLTSKNKVRFFFDILTHSLNNTTGLILKRLGSSIKIPGFQLKREDLNNYHLKKAMTELNFIEGFDYTVGEENSPLNIMLIGGNLIIGIEKSQRNNNAIEKIEENLNNVIKTVVSRKVIIYNFPIDSKAGLENSIRVIMKLGLKPNIYTK